jgi:hypothetical protein
MCWCRPEIRTPNCGRPECHPVVQTMIQQEKPEVTLLQQKDNDWLDDVFSYHAPTPDQLLKYAEIRHWGREFAEALFRLCPPSADRSAAIRLIREAVMTANAAIALEGKA